MMYCKGFDVCGTYARLLLSCSSSISTQIFRHKLCLYDTQTKAISEISLFLMRCIPMLFFRENIHVKVYYGWVAVEIHGHIRE